MTISLEPTRSISPVAPGDPVTAAISAAPSPADALLGNYKRAPGHFSEGDGVYLIDELADEGKGD